MRRITFDIETMGEFRGNGDFSNQEVTIVGVHDSQTDSYSSYTKEELPKLWPLMEAADLLVGYNSDHFDIPILNKYYAGDLGKIKSLDLLKEVKNVLGRRLKLDSIAQATLGEGKSGHGLDAVKWWAEGKVEEVRKYCLDDVRITKELYEYAKKHGSLKYKDFDGVREVKLDTSTWEAEQNGGASLTHTLPF
ncbi:MAG TPA: ribonuclease H-like domain-containing protein [Candidatus Paceibacterota bacterium]|nr:ribonuclease H-like domain-containing protein [Candidatus Paceibacterota bacterium]